MLFADPTHLTDADLKTRAMQLKLNTAQFNACVDSHKYKGDVDTDVLAGDEAGVTGTPMFFINGRLLDGAQPIEAFKRIIDEELALKK
jgi:protein-disulfide isomerase